MNRAHRGVHTHRPYHVRDRHADLEVLRGHPGPAALTAGALPSASGTKMLLPEQGKSPTLSSSLSGRIQFRAGGRTGKTQKDRPFSLAFPTGKSLASAQAAQHCRASGCHSSSLSAASSPHAPQRRAILPGRPGLQDPEVTPWSPLPGHLGQGVQAGAARRETGQEGVQGSGRQRVTTVFILDC